MLVCSLARSCTLDVCDAELVRYAMLPFQCYEAVAGESDDSHPHMDEL
jgi:hypothetical protein